MNTQHPARRLLLTIGAMAIMGLTPLVYAQAAGQAHTAAAIGPAATQATVPTVIQGRVTAIHGALATVRTPDERPYCPPHRMCSMIIIAGKTFTVDVSTAAFESPSGNPVHEALSAGESVVVVGTLQPPHPPSGLATLRAIVVTREVKV